MKKIAVLAFAGLALMVTARAHALPQGAAGAAAAAVKASPDLVSSLVKELGSSPEQAAGAAGALFGVAKSRLKPADFSQIAKAVPGMSSLLKAAPSAGSSSGLAQVANLAGSLGPAAAAFSKLGLSSDLVAKAIPVLTSFVTKSGGANVASLLAGALK